MCIRDRVGRVYNLYVQMGAAVSFAIPEILGLEPDTLARYIQQTPGLDLYKRYFESILREKPHVLSEPEERLSLIHIFIQGAFSGRAIETIDIVRTI